MARTLLTSNSYLDFSGKYIKVTASSTVVYHMMAAAGTAITASNWRIMKVTTTASDSDFDNLETERVEHPSGDASPIFQASLYDTYSYS